MRWSGRWSGSWRSRSTSVVEPEIEPHQPSAGNRTLALSISEQVLSDITVSYSVLDSIDVTWRIS